MLHEAEDTFGIPESLHEGRYVVGARLGAGGMATVHRCTDLELQVDRAVKLRRRQGGPSEKVALQRLADEAHIMAKLNHPKVLPVYDIGQEGPWHYVVMELAVEALSDRMERDGPMGGQDAVRLTIGVLQALEAAHHEGVVHRDIKPQNILLDEEGGPLLADWGIARLSDREQTLTRTHVGMGSMAYMAPEQRQDAHGVTERADLYSVGATLYHLLTAETSVDLFHAKPHSPRWEAVPEVLRAPLQKATALKAQDRYANAAEMVAALTEILPAVPAGAVQLEEIPVLDGGTLTSMPEETVEPVAAPPQTAEADSGSIPWALVLAVGVVGVTVVVILAVVLGLAEPAAVDPVAGTPGVDTPVAEDVVDPTPVPSEDGLAEVEASIPPEPAPDASPVSDPPNIEAPTLPASSPPGEAEPDADPAPSEPDLSASEGVDEGDPPAETVATLPIHGPWRGSLNGRVARLSLDGPTGALRGWLTLQGERGRVAGTYVADGSRLVLQVSGPELAAGTWELSFADGRLDGQVERADSADVFRVHMARAP